MIDHFPSDWPPIPRDVMTPCLIVLGERLDHNLKLMQARCDDAGVALRPHGKMHKCAQVARRQIDTGARGLCVQTVRELTAFAHNGLDDLLLTAPPAPGASRAIVRVAQESAVTVAVDSIALASALDAAAREHAITLDVLIDLDLGGVRCGVKETEAIAFADAITRFRGLRYRGVQAYVGSLQHLSGLSAYQRRQDFAVRLDAIVSDLSSAGYAPAIVSGGGTGSHCDDLSDGVLNEVQAGSYAFMDTEYLADLKSCDGHGFDPACFVIATVTSGRRAGVVTIDAGLKALATDGARPCPSGIDATWSAAGDEHGMLELGPTSASALAPGDRVAILPGHCDPTVNLYGNLALLDRHGSVLRCEILGKH